MIVTPLPILRQSSTERYCVDSRITENVSTVKPRTLLVHSSTFTEPSGLCSWEISRPLSVADMLTPVRFRASTYTLTSSRGSPAYTRPVNSTFAAVLLSCDDRRSTPLGHWILLQRRT